MEERISYLNDYCLPSILNQECDDFYWLIYLDSDTKTKYKLAVEEIVKIRSLRSHLEFTESAATFVQDLRNLSKSLSCQSEYLITTRLDSDDALRKDAILRIQKAFRHSIESPSPNNKIAINLLYGYQLRIRPFYEIVWKRFPSNPFISLVEELGDEIETVLTYFHNDLKNIKILDIVDGAYWLQTVHTANMTTDILGWPLLKINYLKDFGVDTSRIRIAPYIFLYSLYNRINSSLRRRFGAITP